MKRLEHYFTNNENLKSNNINIKYAYKAYDFMLHSDNGVFSKDRIDFGSRLLVETFLEHHNEESLKILDVGCGYGFLSIVLAKVIKAEVTAIDINNRALELTNQNAINHQVQITTLYSDGYSKINDQYDIIITNPPVRVGKVILTKLLMDAKDHLTPDGELWYVLRKDHGAKGMMETLSKIYNIEIINKKNGFYIFCAKRLDK